MQIKTIWSVCFLSAFMMSCSNEELSKEAYLEYMRDPSNGLVQSKNINEIDITLQQQPTAWMASRDSSKSHEIWLYFTLSYSANHKEILSYKIHTLKEYSDRANLLSFHMNEYVTIVTDKKDTILLSEAVFEQTYGSGNASNVLLAFDKKEVLDNSENYFNLFLRDIGINVGNQVFQFDKRKINHIPELKLK